MIQIRFSYQVDKLFSIKVHNRAMYRSLGALAVGLKRPPLRVVFESGRVCCLVGFFAHGGGRAAVFVDECGCAVIGVARCTVVWGHADPIGGRLCRGV